MKLLIVLGEGGHTKELLNLVCLLGGDYEYAYLMTSQDPLAATHLPIPGPIYRIIRPRDKQDNFLLAAVKTSIAASQSLIALIRERPKAVIGTGPAIVVPVSVVGKLLGVRVIFVETGSRVSRLSLTGRIMYHLADIFFVQWPVLQQAYPKAIYAGRLV
jgi:beta-1,4-N-acetylglucosaminyltransferase